jgi:hypothetical protein
MVVLYPTEQAKKVQKQIDEATDKLKKKQKSK